MAVKQQEAAPAGEPREVRVLFGWCMQYTEDHEHCRTSFSDQYGNTYICSCECHGPTA